MTLLRDRSPDFDELGVRVFAISRDHPWSHAAWAAALELDFPLLSDWEGDAVRAFHVEQSFCGLTGIAQRSAFLVARDGTIERTWLYDTYEVPDVDELLEAARALARPPGGAPPAAPDRRAPG